MEFLILVSGSTEYKMARSNEYMILILTKREKEREGGREWEWEERARGLGACVPVVEGGLGLMPSWG